MELRLSFFLFFVFFLFFFLFLSLCLFLIMVILVVGRSLPRGTWLASNPTQSQSHTTLILFSLPSRLFHVLTVLHNFPSLFLSSSSCVSCLYICFNSVYVHNRTALNPLYFVQFFLSLLPFMPFSLLSYFPSDYLSHLSFYHPGLQFHVPITLFVPSHIYWSFTVPFSPTFFLL